MSKPVLVIGNKNYSSWSLRAWLVLRELGVEFRELPIRLGTPGFRDEIRKHNPAGRVPALKDGSNTVWDSLAIAEYAAELHPSAWPADRARRSQARSISAEMHSSFQALRQALPMNCRARGRKVQLSEEVSQDIGRIQQIWRTCRSRNAGEGPWLFGSFSIADAMYAPVAARFVTYGIACGEVEQAYVDTIFALPSLREWLRDAREEPGVIEMYEVGR